MFKVEDFGDLEGLGLDKLIKLRDIAKDYCIETHRDWTEAECRLLAIQHEIELRKKKEVG